MDRKTKTIITPVDGHEVVLNAWVTGREQEYIEEPLMARMKMSMKRDVPEIEASDAVSALTEVKHRKIETIVVSTQHDQDVTLDQIREDITENVIFNVLPPDLFDKDKIVLHINPT